ncbi:MAG: restriction endonuclease [Xanthomonadales bacterium]|nr:restriction endonuclease [Xanthomonadales bacterium]
MSLLLKILVLAATAAAVASLVGLALQLHRPQRLRARAGLGTTDALKWREFVRLTSEVLARRGFRAVEEEHALNPRGYDLAFQRGNKRYLVQFKQGRATRVNAESLRQLRQAMTEHEAAGGLVISTGTVERHAGALDPTIEILEGEALWLELEPLLEGKLREVATAAIRHSFQLRIGS